MSASSDWTAFADKVAPTCSGAEYDGFLGAFGTADECLAKAIANRDSGSRITYALWHGDNGNGCFVCDLSDRGPSSSWKFNDVKGAVSFVGPPLPPQGAGCARWAVSTSGFPA